MLSVHTGITDSGSQTASGPANRAPVTLCGVAGETSLTDWPSLTIECGIFRHGCPAFQATTPASRSNEYSGTQQEDVITIGSTRTGHLYSNL